MSSWRESTGGRRGGVQGWGTRAELQEGLSRSGETPGAAGLVQAEEAGWLKRHPGSGVQGMVLGSVLPQDRAVALHG